MKCLQRGTIIVAFGGLLLACGQKGPLLLPDAPKHKRSGAPLTSPAKPAKPDAPVAPSPSGDIAPSRSGGVAPAASPPPASHPAPPSPASSFNAVAPTALTARS